MQCLYDKLERKIDNDEDTDEVQKEIEFSKMDATNKQWVDG